MQSLICYISYHFEWYTSNLVGACVLGRMSSPVSTKSHTSCRKIYDEHMVYLSSFISASPEQGIKLLGLLLTGSTGTHMASRNGLTPDMHWLARDLGCWWQHCGILLQEIEYAVWSLCWLLVDGAAPTARLLWGHLVIVIGCTWQLVASCMSNHW